MSTPTEEVWKGVGDLPDFKPTFPKWHDNKLASHVGSVMDDKAIDLLQVRVYFASESIKI